jgi:predicted kinase
MPRHLINLICGSTGAGKTNYAIELTQRLGAIRISIDEWMTALFLIDR